MQSILRQVSLVLAPGTSYDTNPNAMESLKENSIFTNCALTDDGNFWWEEMSDTPPSHLKTGTARIGRLRAIRRPLTPNARFTAPASQCPVIASEWEDPQGRADRRDPLGGRRATTVPLVSEALSWRHGTFLGSGMGSEKTAAAAGG